MPNLGVIGSKDFIYPFSLSGFFVFDKDRENVLDEVEKNDICFLIVEKDFYEKNKELLEKFQENPKNVLFVMPEVEKFLDEKEKELKKIAIQAIGVDLWKEKKE